MTDVNQEEGVEAVRDEKGYWVGEDKLTFTVPKNTQLEGATPGDESEHSFNYTIVETPEQAQAIMSEKEWDIVELVNRKLKADARAAVYQRELNKHKPIATTKTQAQLFEQFVRTLMLGAGYTRADAEKQADAMGVARQ